MDLGLQGRKAIVVGGARGIGYAVAEVLAREGADVALSARGEDSVKDAVASLSRYGTRIVGRPVNVKNTGRKNTVTKVPTWRRQAATNAA